MTVSGSEKGALEDTQCLNLQGKEGEKERGCVRERGVGEESARRRAVTIDTTCSGLARVRG